LNKIYISGDSYCKYRSAGNNDWPALLARLLDLDLQGQGYEGDSWWYTRVDLINYLESATAAETELFVICHTDPHRILTDRQRIVQNLSEELDQVRRVYYKYIHTDSIHNWTTLQWYRELNQLLKDRRVVHLQCFDSTVAYFDQLVGLKFAYPLTNISREEPGAGPEKFMLDDRRNHFSTENNVKLANFIHSHYLANTNDLNTAVAENFTDPGRTW